MKHQPNFFTLVNKNEQFRAWEYAFSQILYEVKSSVNLSLCFVLNLINVRGRYDKCCDPYFFCLANGRNLEKETKRVEFLSQAISRTPLIWVWLCACLDTRSIAIIFYPAESVYLKSSKLIEQHTRPYGSHIAQNYFCRIAIPDYAGCR